MLPLKDSPETLKLSLETIGAHWRLLDSAGLEGSPLQSAPINPTTCDEKSRVDLQPCFKGSLHRS